MTQKEVKVADNTIAVETFTYDGLGRTLTADKQEGQYTVSESEFAYSDIGHISDAWETIGGLAAKHIQYAYDNAGHRTQTVYPDASAIDRTNTWDGRIDTLSRDAEALVEYQYAGPRVARRTYPMPEVETDMLYDNLGRIQSIDAGAELIKLSYDYVANSNNIEKITFDHRAGDPYNEYVYDNLDRLTEADYLVGLLDEGEVFGMDDLGNRTTVNLRSGVDQVYTTATPNLTNRYTEIDSEPLDYDEAGNLTRDHDGYYHVYDYENRVTRIYKMDGQTEVDVAQYAYDALGRRIGKWDAVASEATFYYHNDNWQVLAEYDGSNNLQRHYIYGNYIDEPLVMSNGTSDYYYAHDHLYSTVALTNALGQVVERCEYDAYGTVHIMDASYNPRTTSNYGNPYTFTGRQLDILDNGTFERMHYRFRDYDPPLGRFMQHDPLSYFDSMNLYEYVRSAPISHSDPYGLTITTYDDAITWGPARWVIGHVLTTITYDLTACSVDLQWQNITGLTGVTIKMGDVTVGVGVSARAAVDATWVDCEIPCEDSDGHKCVVQTQVDLFATALVFTWRLGAQYHAEVGSCIPIAD